MSQIYKKGTDAHKKMNDLLEKIQGLYPPTSVIRIFRNADFEVEFDFPDGMKSKMNIQITEIKE